MKSLDEVLEYTDTIRATQLMFDTKLCLYLRNCRLTTTDLPLRGSVLTHHTTFNMFTNSNQILFSLILINSTYSYECRLQIANQLTALEYIRIDGMDSEVRFPSQSNTTIMSSLFQATQLKALSLSDIPKIYYEQLLTVLPSFSHLQEIELEEYFLLPALSNLSKLPYLKICIFGSVKNFKQYCHYLLQLLSKNRNTLRYLYLYNLDGILTEMGIFLNCIALCTNLTELSPHGSTLTPEDISLWINTVSNMKALVILYLQFVTLYDTGLESLCAGLAYHPAIGRLVVKIA